MIFIAARTSRRIRRSIRQACEDDANRRTGDGIGEPVRLSDDPSSRRHDGRRRPKRDAQGRQSATLTAQRSAQFRKRRREDAQK